MISSKSFANLCDCVICPHYNKVCFNVNTKRLFLSAEQNFFNRFIRHLEEIKFKGKFELIYHCTDETFDRFSFQSIRKYCTHIYAENCEIKHRMISQIPLGFKDNEHPTRLNVNKDILCYLNISFYNDKELKFVKCRKIRKDCIEHFNDKEWVNIDNNLSFEEYNYKINRSKFVICPFGYGLDTLRFYEAAYVGATPIVLNSGLNDLYIKYGAIIVDEWSHVTEELLRNHTHKKISDELFKVEYFIKS